MSSAKGASSSKPKASKPKASKPKVTKPKVTKPKASKKPSSKPTPTKTRGNGVKTPTKGRDGQGGRRTLTNQMGWSKNSDGTYSSAIMPGVRFRKTKSGNTTTYAYLD